jgi:hypothetical protein
MEPLSEGDSGIIIIKEVFDVVNGLIGLLHSLLYLKLQVFHYNMAWRLTVSNLLLRSGYGYLQICLSFLFYCSYVTSRSIP